MKDQSLKPNLRKKVVKSILPVQSAQHSAPGVAMALVIKLVEIVVRIASDKPACTFDVHDSGNVLKISGSGLDATFDRQNGTAKVAITPPTQNGSVDVSRAICNLKSLLEQWHAKGASDFLVEPLDIASLSMAIWKGLQELLHSASEAKTHIDDAEGHRIKAAKWLQSLPHGTPLILQGSAEFFDEDVAAAAGRLTRVFILDRRHGAPTLFTMDQVHWRDFRPETDDNGAILATSDALSQVGNELPEVSSHPEICQRAEVVRATHGQHPKITPQVEISPFTLPALEDWLEGIRQASITPQSDGQISNFEQ